MSLWPVLQLGWGGTADVAHSLLTQGSSTLIGLHLRAATAPTRKVYVSAIDAQGRMAAGLRVTRTAGGAICEPASEAIGIAYRCFAGNGVYDPCWKEAQAASPAVFCLDTPWSQDVTKLGVTSKLAPITGSTGVGPPWGLRLSDGQECVLEHGAHDSYNGRVVDYYCGANEVVLHGLETTGAQWRAQTATYSGGQYNMGPAEGITIAWFGISDRN